MIGTNPCERVRLPRRIRRHPRFLNEQERARLLKAANERGRDAYLLVAMGLYLGLRKAELLSLDWKKNFDFPERLAYVKNREHFTAKSGKERAIPMCQEIIDILMPFYQPSGLVVRPDKPYVSEKRYRWDFRTLLGECAKDAGIDPGELTPHVLRHTFASIAAQKGVSLYKIATWMGHSMVEVTELYAHLCAYDDDIDKLNPSTVRPAAARPHLRIVK